MNKVKCVEMRLTTLKVTEKLRNEADRTLMGASMKIASWFHSLSVPGCHLTSDIVNQMLDRTTVLRQKGGGISFASL